MHNENYKAPRWISILLAAEMHRELTVLALDESITLAILGRSLIEEFLGNREWQLSAISRAKALK